MKIHTITHKKYIFEDYTSLAVDSKLVEIFAISINYCRPIVLCCCCMCVCFDNKIGLAQENPTMSFRIAQTTEPGY